MITLTRQDHTRTAIEDTRFEQKERLSIATERPSKGTKERDEVTKERTNKANTKQKKNYEA